MNAAVIVETRVINNIQSIIDRHLDKLPGFDLVIFHGSENKHLFNYDCIKYEVDVNTLHEYNHLLTSMLFWQKLSKYDRVLIFQHDTGLFKAIDDFLEWDYIGAPWQFQEFGGNGGLSIRNPKAMINTIIENPYSSNFGNEDVYFSDYLVGNLAPRSECKKFSVESEFVLGTIGYHLGSDSKRFLTDEQINKIINQ